MYDEQYIRQVRLLLQCLPVIRDQDYFALKGGTAINLIFRDLPRLSVDIDLTYLPIEERGTFLTNFKKAMLSLKESIAVAGKGRYNVKEVVSKRGQLVKLLLVIELIAFAWGAFPLQ